MGAVMADGNGIDFGAGTSINEFCSEEGIAFQEETDDYCWKIKKVETEK